MSDLEKRVAALEREVARLCELRMSDRSDIDALERIIEESQVLKGQSALESRQPAPGTWAPTVDQLRKRQSAPEPEPESVCGTCSGKGVIYGDRFGTFRRPEPCPDCQPALDQRQVGNDKATAEGSGVPGRLSSSKVDQCYCPAGECAQATDGSCRRRGDASRFGRIYLALLIAVAIFSPLLPNT